MTDTKRRKVIREDVVRRDGLECCFCCKQLSFRTITLEHIVPVSKRGSFNRSNLTISCEKCNSTRGDKDFFEYLEKFPNSEYKITKYKKLYSTNLKIKILNIAKEECLKEDHEIPFELIQRACKLLRIKKVDSSLMKCYFGIALDTPQPRKQIKHSFENAIKVINIGAIMFTPIRDVIIVKKAETAEKSKGGIFIPATVENREFLSGIVVAAGDGIVTESGNIVELRVKVGQRIVFGKSGCADIQVDGENFVMMRESNILGIEQ